MQDGMMILVEVATAAFTTLAAMDFFSHFPGKKVRRFSTRFSSVAAGIVFALLLFASKALWDNTLIANAILLIGGVGVLLVLYRGPAKRLLYAAVPAVISLAADLFVGFLEQYAQVLPTDAAEADGVAIAGALAARLLFFALVKIVISFSAGMPMLAGRFWYGLLVIPFGSVILLLRPVAKVFDNSDSFSYYVVAGLVLLYINVAVFAMFEELSKQMANKQQLELSERTLLLEQKHFKELEKNRLAIRAIWHDMNNHIAAMRRMAADGEYDELHEYLDGMQTEVGEILHFVDTGNPALDAALNEKQMRARQAGVSLELSATIPPEMELDPLSMVSILSNALDNAIESCAKLEPEHRIVTILLTYKNGFLGISVKNPTDGLLFESPAGDYETDKADKESHGIGLKSIRNAVDRLEGQLRVTHIDNMFAVDVVVPVKFEPSQTGGE